MSGYVALCLPLPGAVVTYFVTGSRTSSGQRRDQLIRQPGHVTGRTVEITTADPEVQAYAFALG